MKWDLGPNTCGTKVLIYTVLEIPDAARTRIGVQLKAAKTSIVLIDDDALLLRALERLVTSAGFRAIPFNRPREALRARLPKRRGCIVLDLFMPEMNGLEFFHNLRAAGNRLPVILVTGHQDEESQRLISQIEHVAVLYKPFAESELLRAIATATQVTVEG